MKLNLKAFKKTIKKAAKKTASFVKKKAPEILTGVGIAAGVGATISACKQTRTVDEAVEPYKEKIREAREAQDGKALTKAYTNVALAYAKHYKTALILEGLSIGSNLGAYGVSAKRYARLDAAYASVVGAFGAYRERNKALIGEDKEALVNAALEEMVVEETVVDEKGKKKKQKHTELVKVGDTPYGLWFDETNPNWVKDPEINKMFIDMHIGYMNRKLQRDKFVSYNRVLEELGYGRDRMTPEGQLIGWYIDEEHPNTYIDSGMFTVARERNNDFLLGRTNCVYLVFNVMPSAWRRIGNV